MPVVSRANFTDFLLDFTVAKSMSRLPVEPCLLGISQEPANPLQHMTGRKRDEEYFFFYYVLSGEVDFVSADERLHLQKGEALLSCSSVDWKCLPVSSSEPFAKVAEATSAKGSSDSFRSLFYVVHGETALSLGRQLLEQHGSKTALVPHSPSLELLLGHLQELRGDASWNTPDESVFAYRFLVSLLLEQTNSSQPDETLVPASGESSDDEQIPENLRRATKYVEKHFADTLLNVETIAKVAGFSKYHFIRLFEKTYGISPWKYLLAQRLYHAAQLLAQDKTLPLKAIIQQCGFTSETYFCKAFRKTYQRSPGSHRRLMSNTIPTTL